MRLLADMNVSCSVVRYLRDKGHDVEHLRELKMQNATETELFARAGLHKRIILTIDFDAQHQVGSAVAPSQMVILRLNDTRVARIIDQLSTVLDDAERLLAKGAMVIVVDDQGVRGRGATLSQGQ